MAVTGDETETGTAGDMTACQLRNPSSSLPQGVAGASAHSSQKPKADALQKRELRLMKNRLPVNPGLGRRNICTTWRTASLHWRRRTPR
ncbi:uncharacterized protein LOC132994437 isoform X4 [Labrus mixtus]|uniref:uncharacterized protein LOC132994437 isoform X4 n=1 Tax=Labrus mixtus TaxID=508554 RepID=UPI0029C0352C|nr:uncharacterized protein LOC132994437 isoform X4 [Labrus mixtus]